MSEIKSKLPVTYILVEVWLISQSQSKLNEIINPVFTVWALSAFVCWNWNRKLHRKVLLIMKDPRDDKMKRTLILLYMKRLLSPQELKNLIPKSAVGTLSANSSNVINLIIDAYNVSTFFNINFYFIKLIVILSSHGPHSAL